MADDNESRENVRACLVGIDRYNPENLGLLESYVEEQARNHFYDLEANLTVLKLYQFNPNLYQTSITAQILLKALTNLPHTDFTLCKCLIDSARLEKEEELKLIVSLADCLETCEFQQFWKLVNDVEHLTMHIKGFSESICSFICYVVSTTYQVIPKTHLKKFLGNVTDTQVSQWVAKNGWKDNGDGTLFVANQEESIKTKNIKEKIRFEGVAAIMATAAGPGMR